MNSWLETLQREKAEKLLEEALGATPVEPGYPLAKGDVRLECGHKLFFEVAIPHKKERLWCRHCQAEKAVAAIGTDKAYRVKCEVCYFSRGKTGRLEADMSAARHRVKKPHHIVHVMEANGTIVHTFQDDPETVLTLPDEPPY